MKKVEMNLRLKRGLSPLCIIILFKVIARAGVQQFLAPGLLTEIFNNCAVQKWYLGPHWLDIHTFLDLE